MRNLQPKIKAVSFYLPEGYTTESWKDAVDNFWETSTKRKELEKIQESIRDRLNLVVELNKIPPEETWELNGHQHKVTVSKERESRTIPSIKELKAIHKILGNRFYEIISVSMKELEIALTGDELEKYTTKDYTGVRSFSPAREK